MAALSFKEGVIDFISGLIPMAVNLTKDMADAEDLVQETMFRALSNEDKFKEGTNLKGWLFTIMRNIFINGYRRKAKRNTIIDTTDNLYYLNSAASKSTTLNQGDANFMMEDIMTAINGLSDDFKVPFMLHHEGFKYQEIADQLNLPLGTVKSRIFFARKDLKEKLSIYKGNK